MCDLLPFFGLPSAKKYELSPMSFASKRCPSAKIRTGPVWQAVPARVLLADLEAPVRVKCEEQARVPALRTMGLVCHDRV